jgi:hypothetical protein
VTKSSKQGLNLDRVVLLGRTLEEYARFFALDLPTLRNRKILDVAGGVSSFTAEARARGLDATAFDRIYSSAADAIQARCEHDLAEVAASIGDKSVYRWDFYKSAEGMRTFRARAYQTFLSDFENNPHHYVAGALPKTPFADRQFDLTLVSYLLFVYEDQLTYDFHKQSLRELMRITRGEIRIYPTVTFEAEPSSFLARIRNESEFASWQFKDVPTTFEFLRNSNSYLKISRQPQPAH